MYSVIDIETEAIIKPVLIGYYRKGVYREYFTVEEVLKELVKENIKQVCYAHYGCSFDFIFILDYILKKDVKGLKNIILNNGKIYELHYRNVIFRDSYLLLRSALKEVTKAFNVEHYKQEKEEDFYKQITEENIKSKGEIYKEISEYLYFDCLGLYESIELFFDELDIDIQKKIPLTLHQIILKKIKKDYNIIIPCLSKEKNDFIRGGYYGGRTEIYRNKGEKVNIYDVNSLYAFSQSKIIPFDTGKIINQIPIRYIENENIEGYVDCKIKVKEDFISLIPLKTGKLIQWGFGEVRAVYPINLLRKFLSLKLGSIEKIYKGIIFYNNEKVLEDYTNDLIELKIKAEKNGEKAKRYIYKLMLCSLHGKLAQKTEREQILINPNIDYIRFNANKIIVISDIFNIFSEVKEDTNILSNVAIAGYITSNATCYMYDFLKEVEKNLFYTDTDSLHINNELSKKHCHQFELGKFKLESIYNNIEYIQPKAYKYEENGKSKFKIKGFRGFRKETNDCEYEQLGSVKDLLKIGYLRKKEVTKTFKKPYTTRELRKNTFFTKKFLTK